MDIDLFMMTIKDSLEAIDLVHSFAYIRDWYVALLTLVEWGLIL
jgi:hypothetical protein